VRDVVARRLARLDAPTLRVLDVAAVCGLEFDVSTLARVDDRPVVEVLKALDGAIEATLITATDRQGRYAFAHALVAETIVAALPASRRALLHLQVADVLADRHDAGEVGAGEVVRHLRAGGALAAAERVVTWELAAAREASAALAHADAAAHYEAALAAPVAGSERGEILLALGDAHDRAGRRGPARAAFAEAAELGRTAGDSDLLARAALGHGGVAVVIAAADPAAVRLLEEALAATPASDPATSARLLARLSVELYYSDRARARELSARAVEQARRAGDAAALAAALNARRVALWAPHHADERLAAADAMIAAAEAAGDREAMLQGRNWRVVDLLELGRVPEAAAEIDAYEALADAVALPHFRWYVPLWRATLAQLAGRWGEADELSDRALALGRQADDPNAPLFVGIQRHTGLYAQGRLGEMDRGRLVEGGASSPAAAEWLVNLALIDAATGATEDARRLVRELSRKGFAMDANWHGACVLAEAAVRVADRDAGAAVYALLEPHARLFPVIARAVACLGSAERYLGRLAGLLGRHDEAVTRLRRAVAENDRVGAGPYAAAALLHLGEALASSGEHDSARDVLEQAAARADALDMPAVAADARRLLGATVA
jgi:tetratricopeptide (TPR) repeat protein